MLCDLSTCRCWPHTLDGRNPIRPYPLLDIASEFIGSAACSYTEMVQTGPTSDRNGVVQTWVLQNWIVCLVLNTSLRQVLATSRTLSQEMLISRMHNGRGNRCLDITILVEIIDKQTPLQSPDLVGETPHVFSWTPPNLSAELPHVGWIHGVLLLRLKNSPYFCRSNPSSQITIKSSEVSPPSKTNEISIFQNSTFFHSFVNSSFLREKVRGQPTLGHLQRVRPVRRWLPRRGSGWGATARWAEGIDGREKLRFQETKFYIVSWCHLSNVNIYIYNPGCNFLYIEGANSPKT